MVGILCYNTMDVVFDTLASRRAVTVDGDRAVLLDYADRDLNSPHRSCANLVKEVLPLCSKSLCAAEACSLSELWWLDSFAAQRQGNFSQFPECTLSKLCRTSAGAVVEKFTRALAL